MALIRTLIFTILTLAFAGTAQAGSSPMYFGLGIADYSAEGNDTTADGIFLNFGIDIGNYFAIEAVAANSDRYESTTTGDYAEIDYYAALYGRFNLRYDHLTLYLMAGYATLSATTSFYGTDDTYEDSGLTYAAGIDLYGTKNTAISVRYYDYIDEDSHITGINIGLNFYFDVPRINKRY